MCLRRPDIKLERMLAYCSFVRRGWCLVGEKGLNDLRRTKVRR